MYKKFAYTERADIWSLGVTMYTLLTRRYPFDCAGREPLNVIHNRLPRLMEREDLGKLSTARREILRLLLQENTVHRITASGALKLDWFEDLATGRQVTKLVEDVEKRLY
jgi:serine/threonine protein kinase